MPVLRKRPTPIRKQLVPQPDPAEPYSIVGHIMAFRRPMSAAELAPILGVSDDVLYRMVRDGKIPQLIIPGRTVVRFDPATICTWLRKHNPVLARKSA